jgi:hypothetical protein
VVVGLSGAVSVLCAYSKFSNPMDNLLLQPGEKDEPAAGLFVPFRSGPR